MPTLYFLSKRVSERVECFRPQIAIYWQCLKHTLLLMPAMRDNENRFSTVKWIFSNSWITHCSKSLNFSCSSNIKSNSNGGWGEREREGERKRLNEECRQQHMCVLLIKNKIQFYFYIKQHCYKVEGKSHSIYCK